MDSPLHQLDHDAFLRRSFDVAREARSHGNHPFGAILVDAAGKILIETENGFMPERDMTGHAERLLATQASRQLGRALPAARFTPPPNPARCAPAPSIGLESAASYTVCLNTA